MDYADEKLRLANNQRKMEEATEDIEVGEGETVSPVSMRRKEQDREEQLIEGAIDIGAQFMEMVIDIAESLDLMRQAQENA